jgi:hypothetical protein
MTMAAVMSRSHVEGALFAVAGGALLLLIDGIHNAWDTVTYIVSNRIAPNENDEERHERGRHR